MTALHVRGRSQADLCRCFSAISADIMNVDEADYQLPPVYDCLDQKKVTALFLRQLNLAHHSLHAATVASSMTPQVIAQPSSVPLHRAWLT